MIKIALAEDEDEAADKIKTHISRYEEEKSVKCQLTVYKDGLSFIQNYKPRFDAVFLDIEMPYMNGISAAERLREFDSTVPIVFITNLKQYALRGYEVNAMDFLVKPITYAAFSTMMNRVRKCIDSKQTAEVLLQNGRGSYRIKLSDVYYLEVTRHYIIYHTTEGEIQFWGSLSEEEKRLPKDCFARCNNCYLVNLQYVSKIDGCDLYLGDTVLNISRGKKAEFLSRLNDFVTGRQ